MESPPRTNTWDSAQVVRFYVGAQQCALNIMQVKEIINPVTIAPMPHAPDFIEGIIDLRGAFLPVLDLRKRFGVSTSAPLTECKFLIALLRDSTGTHKIGLIVDRVLDVRRVESSELEDAPPLTRSKHAHVVIGVTTWDDEIALLLDIERLLSESERTILSGNGSNHDPGAKLGR